MKWKGAIVLRYIGEKSKSYDGTKTKLNPPKSSKSRNCGRAGALFFQLSQGLCWVKGIIGA